MPLVLRAHRHDLLEPHFLLPLDLLLSQPLFLCSLPLGLRLLALVLRVGLPLPQFLEGAAATCSGRGTLDPGVGPLLLAVSRIPIERRTRRLDSFNVRTRAGETVMAEGGWPDESGRVVVARVPVVANARVRPVLVQLQELRGGGGGFRDDEALAHVEAAIGQAIELVRARRAGHTARHEVVASHGVNVLRDRRGRRSRGVPVAALAVIIRLARILRVAIRRVRSHLIVILRADNRRLHRVRSAGRRNEPRVRSLIARLVVISRRHRVLRRHWMIDVAAGITAVYRRFVRQGHEARRSRVTENLIGWHVRRESTGREDFRRNAIGPVLLRQHLELGQLAQKTDLVVGTRVPG